MSRAAPIARFTNLHQHILPQRMLQCSSSRNRFAPLLRFHSPALPRRRPALPQLRSIAFNNNDVLEPFLAASGTRQRDADAANIAYADFQPPTDRIASARCAFPFVAIAIDDASTTDVDDAISFEPAATPTGTCTVHIHISDVDRWVSSASSPLFRLLEQRASSAYFPGLHLPMLPPSLSIPSSLLPVSSNHPSSPHNQPNPCISISISVDSSGRITNTTVAPHFLPNLVRLTYDVADSALRTAHSCPSFREHWQTPPSPLLAMPKDPRAGFVYDEEHALAFCQLQGSASSADSGLTREIRQTLLALSSVALSLRMRRKGGGQTASEVDVDFYSEFHATELPSPATSSSSSSSSSSASLSSSHPSSASPSIQLDVCGRMSSSTIHHAPPPSNREPSSQPTASTQSPRGNQQPSTADTPSSSPSAHRLNARHTVAEFMIAACVASATWCSLRSIPVHYRSQPPPNLPLAQLQRHASRAFAQAAQSSLNSLAPGSTSACPSAEVMAVFASKMMTVSGMQGAHTNIYPQPHHGIGADSYAQCTSPIRRFSDLLMQRQMKASLGFADAVACDHVKASLARQNAVRGGIKRLERLLERRALVSILRSRVLSAGDPSQLLYHCVVIKTLPPGKGSPGNFGDFPTDTTLLPPRVVADMLTRAPHSSPVRCGWFMVLVPALGALERCLLPLGTPPGTCFKAAAVAGNSAYGRISFVKVT